MKIGFLFISETGHTLSVLNRLEPIYKEAGHAVEKISLLEGYDSKKQKLTAFPKLKDYDLIIFATPVQAFSLHPAMSQYLKQLELKKEQKVALLITQYFRRACLGGNRALKKMKLYLSVFQAQILAEFIVHWCSKARENQIDEALKLLGSVTNG